MLTKEQVIEQIKAGRESSAFDGRDYGRLANFLESEHLETLGFGLKEGADPTDWDSKVIEWTEENVRTQLAKDVEFGFEKALNKRGISASCMHSVIEMWMWVFEEDELLSKSDDLYAQYGLPFLKAVAIKFDLPNEIGDDEGNEHKYSESGYD